MASLQRFRVRGHSYWRIVQSQRINGKPGIRVLAYLGKADDLLARLRAAETLTIRSVSQRQRQGDRPWLIADNDKLSGLGWKCENALTDALQQTLQYYNVAKQHQAA